MTTRRRTQRQEVVLVVRQTDKCHWIAVGSKEASGLRLHRYFNDRNYFTAFESGRAFASSVATDDQIHGVDHADLCNILGGTIYKRGDWVGPGGARRVRLHWTIDEGVDWADVPAVTRRQQEMLLDLAWRAEAVKVGITNGPPRRLHWDEYLEGYHGMYVIAQSNDRGHIARSEVRLIEFARSHPSLTRLVKNIQAGEATPRRSVAGPHYLYVVVKVREVELTRY